MTNNANPGVTIKRRASTMQVRPPAPEEQQEQEDGEGEGTEEAEAVAKLQTKHKDPGETADEDTTPEREEPEQLDRDAQAMASMKADLEAGMLARDASTKYGWSVPTVRKKAKEWGIKLRRGRPTAAAQAASSAASTKPRKSKKPRKHGKSSMHASVSERVGALEWLMKVAAADGMPLEETAARAKRAIEAYEKLTQ